MFGVFKLLNAHLAVIITHLTFNMQISTWMMKSFFDGVPKGFEGCAFWLLRFEEGLSGSVLPVSLSGLITMSAMLFMLHSKSINITLQPNRAGYVLSVGGHK